MDSPVTPPRPFRQAAPDRVVIREGGGCLSVFGLPFLAAGVLVTLIGTQVIPVTNRSEVPAWAWPLIVLMGLVFVAVGGALVFGRRWTTLDTGKGLIVKQAGLLLPVKREQFPLPDYDGVRFRFEEGDSDTADRYPIALTGRAGRPDFALTSPVDYAAAREQAGFLANFLRVPLVDATTDHETVVAGAAAVLPGSRGSTFAEHAARPPFMRSTVEQSRGRVKIVIPGPGFRLHLLLGFALPVFFLWFVIPDMLEFFDRTRTPAYVQTAFTGFILLFFGVLPAVGAINRVIRASRSRTSVEASAEGIRIEEQRAWRKRTTVIPAAGIFGVDYNSAENALRAWENRPGNGTVATRLQLVHQRRTGRPPGCGGWSSPKASRSSAGRGSSRSVRACRKTRCATSTRS